MRRILLAAGAAISLCAGAAHATTISDPPNDFLKSFSGPHDGDLDVISFTVDLNAALSQFDISATLDAPLDTSKSNIYVIGVDTGAGAIHPFANIGEAKVVFDKAIVVRENGTAFLGANPLTPTFSGPTFSVSVPFSLLPASVAGFQPSDYRFNLWPRIALVANSDISDFAPQNNTIRAVPEPASWALAILGFGFAGGALRRRRAVSPA